MLTTLVWLGPSVMEARSAGSGPRPVYLDFDVQFDHRLSVDAQKREAELIGWREGDKDRLWRTVAIDAILGLISSKSAEFRANYSGRLPWEFLSVDKKRVDVDAPVLKLTMIEGRSDDKKQRIWSLKVEVIPSNLPKPETRDGEAPPRRPVFPLPAKIEGDPEPGLRLVPDDARTLRYRQRLWAVIATFRDNLLGPQGDLPLVLQHMLQFEAPLGTAIMLIDPTDPCKGYPGGDGSATNQWPLGILLLDFNNHGETFRTSLFLLRCHRLSPPDRDGKRKLLGSAEYESHSLGIPHEPNPGLSAGGILIKHDGVRETTSVAGRKKRATVPIKDERTRIDAVKYYCGADAVVWVYLDRPDELKVSKGRNTEPAELLDNNDGKS